MPVALTIDMGAERNIGALDLHQDEARALTIARYYPAGEGTRIRDYVIYASKGGSDWGTPVASGRLPNERGVKEILLPTGTAGKRYIRLIVLNNYKGDGLVQVSGIDLIKKEHR
jgi:alpha-L-fucosidase